MITADDIIQELKSLGNESQREILQRFFKTGKGQYGYGDMFLGIKVPVTRTVAKRHKDVGDSVVKELLQSKWHEVRLCALLIMVEKTRKATLDECHKWCRIYLSNTRYINNWDLVDLSAPQIVGKLLTDNANDILSPLADSKFLWDNRIAIVSTLALIRKGEFDKTYMLADKFMHHSHDLMHKATGWMLREAGKRDMNRLRNYILVHGQDMPRTMLRYAIEKFPEEERKRLLKIKTAH
ncbi:MAG: DNA alkylation repair protein [Prevotella sp.]